MIAVAVLTPPDLDQLQALDHVHRVVAGGWEVASVDTFEDDLSLADRIQLVAANDVALADVLPFPETKNPTE